MSTPQLALGPLEAARALSVSRDTFDAQVLPHLRVVRLGRRILVPVSELERYLHEHGARLLNG